MIICLQLSRTCTAPEQVAVGSVVSASTKLRYARRSISNTCSHVAIVYELSSAIEARSCSWHDLDSTAGSTFVDVVKTSRDAVPVADIRAPSSVSD